MSERQLNMFRSRRHAGDRIAPPKERAIHIAFADAVRVGINPEWFWSHIPMGEYRTPTTAALLKRMGVNPGLPDFVFIGPGPIVWLELKREGGRLSEAQLAVQARIVRNGACIYLWTDDIKDAIDTLRDFGIVRSRVSA